MWENVLLQHGGRRYLLSDGGHQEPAAVTQGGDGPLLLLLIQHLKLVLGERLSRLWHHLDHIQDQDLERGTRARVRSGTACVCESVCVCVGNSLCLYR